MSDEPEDHGPDDEPLDDETGDEELRALVERIAAGEPADVDRELARFTGSTQRRLVEQLLGIGAIGEAHRAGEAAEPASPRQWGRLTILEEVGEGRYAKVFRAHHPNLDVDVALKLVPAADGEAVRVAALMAEARLLIKVDHPNVVRVHDVDHRDGQVGLWMEFIQGRTLEEITKTQGFNAAEAAQVGLDLCRALAAVHRVGVLHGDIKAHNVMRRNGGGTVLVDFGASRPLASTPERGEDVVGTPVYMAPEVLRGEPRSTASDIYSLGILLFHLVTNDYPVYETTRDGFIQAFTSGRQKRLRDLRPDLPDGFVQVVERSLAVDPADRFRSAGAFETALVHWHHPPALDAPRRGTAASAADRRRWVAAALVVLVASFFVVWMRQETTARPDNPNRRDDPQDSELSSPASPTPLPPYRIAAQFYRAARRGETEDQPLTSTSRLAVGDGIYLTLESSAPVHVAVVNEDEKNESFLLFPLRTAAGAEPQPAHTKLRLPDGSNWTVTSVGLEEHFVLFADRERMTDLEAALDQLPRPSASEVEPVPLPPGIAEQLRGVGGLVKRPDAGPTGAPRGFHTIFTTPLAGPETTDARFVRQLTVENPGGRRRAGTR